MTPIFLFFVVSGLVFTATPANAIFDLLGDVATGVFDALLHFASWILIELATVLMSLTMFFFKFFVELAKYNGYVDTPTVVIGWFMVRDVANMFFVVVLLVIAFGTVLGIEQYEWKKTLAHFILAALLVNFSKLIAGLIIDAAHIFTMTFVTAIQNTAGGNLIEMLRMNSILNVVGEDIMTGGIDIKLFGGAVMAFVFALMGLAVVGAYLFVMILRVIVLWVLIILSPMAYIMNVIPQTKQYAKEWWSMFGKEVIVAPVAVFFLWLAFATLGTGDVAMSDLGLNIDGSDAQKVLQQAGVPGGTLKVSSSEVTTWENMANFFIAIAFLFVGLTAVQKVGAVGGSFVGGVLDFGKKVATIASGYAAGRWLVGKGLEKGKKSLMNAPFIGGRSWIRAGKRLDEFRRQNKNIRHIHLIWGDNEEYQDKLDDRVEAVKKQQKDSRAKDMSKNEPPLSLAGTALVNKVFGQIPILKRLGQVDYEWDDEKGDFKYEQERVEKKNADGTTAYEMRDKVDKDGNKIKQKKYVGIVGLDAMTARRNFAEYQEMAAIQMRSPENKKSREHRNRERLLKEGRQLVVAAEDHEFEGWMEKEHADEYQGYAALDDEGKKAFREKKRTTTVKQQKEVEEDAPSFIDEFRHTPEFVEDEDKKFRNWIKAKDPVQYNGYKEMNTLQQWEFKKQHLEEFRKDSMVAPEQTQQFERWLQKENAGAYVNYTAADEPGKTKIITDKQKKKVTKSVEVQKDLGSLDEEFAKDPEVSAEQLKQFGQWLEVEHPNEYKEYAALSSDKSRSGWMKFTQIGADQEVKVEDEFLADPEIVAQQNKQFDAWMQKKHGDEYHGYQGMDKAGKAEFKRRKQKKTIKDERGKEVVIDSDSRLEEFRSNPANVKAVGDTISGINHPERWKGSKRTWVPKRDEGVYSRASRNAAQYIVQHETNRVAEEKLKEAQSKATEAVLMGPLGKKLAEQLGEAEIGAKIGEDIVKGMKNAHLEKVFESSLDKFRKMKDKGNLDLWLLQGNDAASVFARAIQQAKFAEEHEENMAIVKGETQSEVEGTFIEAPAQGKATYAQSFVASAKRIAESLNRVDEAGRAEFGGAALMRLAFHREQARMQGKEGVSMDVQKHMYGMLSNLAENANLDDAINSMGHAIERYETDEEDRKSVVSFNSL